MPTLCSLPFTQLLRVISQEWIYVSFTIADGRFNPGHDRTDLHLATIAGE